MYRTAHNAMMVESKKKKKRQRNHQSQLFFWLNCLQKFQIVTPQPITAVLPRLFLCVTSPVSAWPWAGPAAWADLVPDPCQGGGKGAAWTQGGAACLFSAWFETCLCNMLFMFCIRMPDTSNIAVKSWLFRRALLSSQLLMFHCFGTLLKLTSYEQPQVG